MRGLIGRDDVEPTVLKRQARRICGREAHVGPVTERSARQGDLLRVDIDGHDLHAKGVGDEQGRGPVAAANVQVRAAGLNGEAAEAPHRLLGDAAAVSDVIDEALFESCPSPWALLSTEGVGEILTGPANSIGPPCQMPPIEPA
jgi:hypothetical protein